LMLCPIAQTVKSTAMHSDRWRIEYH